MKSYRYEQLDADAKAYLRFVRDGKGRGSPGVYLTFKSNKPTWALVVGLLVIPLFLWIAYASSKAGWAVALLQTAGVLLGGWLVVFAVRRWMANPDKYAGHFVYFDPEHVYYGKGEEIQIARVGRDPVVEPRGENMVRFDTERGAFTVPAHGRVLAQYVTDYYEALKWVRSRTDSTWVGLNSAEAGAVARHLVEEDREPNTVADTGLEVEEIPNQVSTTGGGGFGLLRYLVVLGAGVAVYALFAFTNPAIQDDMAFEDAKSAMTAAKAENKGFTGAYALRDYLLNDRNRRHRPEALKLLSDLYAAPISRLQWTVDDDNTKDAGMKALHAEVIRMLTDLRTAETPAISVRILLNGVELPGERGKQVRSLFADGFATAVGKDLVVCGAAPSLETKAHIEVNYYQEPNSFNAFRWEAAVRTFIDLEKQPNAATASGSVTVTPNMGGGGFGNPFGGGGGGVGQPAYPSQQFLPDGEGGQEAFPEPLKDVLGEDDAVYRAVLTKMVGLAPERPKIQP